MQEFPLFSSNEIEVDEPVYEESAKVLGPEKENLDCKGPNFVEAFVALGATLVGCTSVGEACHGKPCPHENVGKEEIYSFHQLTSQVCLHNRSDRGIVVDGSPYGHERKEEIFVNKVT
jgi:hypothetical protein